MRRVGCVATLTFRSRTKGAPKPVETAFPLSNLRFFSKKKHFGTPNVVFLHQKDLSGLMRSSLQPPTSAAEQLSASRALTRSLLLCLRRLVSRPMAWARSIARPKKESERTRSSVFLGTPPLPPPKKRK